MSKIIILSPTESLLTKRGKRHPNLADYLTRRGYNVYYISTTFNHAYKTIFSTEEIERARREISYKASFWDVGGYGKNLSMRRILWHRKLANIASKKLPKMVLKGDVVIIPSRPPELIWQVSQLKKLGARLILDIEDIWPDALNTSGMLKKRMFAFYCNRYLWSSINQFDRFIHVAPSFLAWLNRYSSEAQSTFIPLGFDEHRWGIDPPARQLVSGGVIKLAYCGTLTNQFDIMPVLKALVLRRGQFHLTLIGDNGSGERYAEVMNFLHNQGLQSDVSVLGLLPADQLVKELPRHDIIIVPMVSGALPNKVFDSIAAGLPMISLGAGDSSALVEQYDMGWTAPFNQEGVGKVFDRITPEDIRIKTENVFQHRSEYMQRNLFEKYEHVIRDILPSKM